MTYKFANDVRLQGNPAIVNVVTGEVLINKSKWLQLSDYEKVLILLHEEGHYRNKSVDEIKADAYMVDKYLQEADTPERRQEIVRTIFGNVSNSKENAIRKAALVKYLLQWDSDGKGSEQSKRLQAVLKDSEFYASFDPMTAVTLVGAALDLGLKGYNLWLASQNKMSYWQDLNNTERTNAITSAADTVIQEEFFRNSGNFEKLLTYARMSAGDRKSLACKTFELIASAYPIDSKMFGRVNEIDIAEASAIFWNKQGYTLPQWFVQRCEYLKDDLDIAWNNLSFFDKVRYSTEYKVYVVLFIIAIFLIWKYV